MRLVELVEAAYDAVVGVMTRQDELPAGSFSVNLHFPLVPDAVLTVFHFPFASR